MNISIKTVLTERDQDEKRRVKIVATVGPASNSEATLRELIVAGANVFRLNFSHGSHKEHLESITKIRKVSNELMMPVAVLQDLSGPKIRISEFEQGSIDIKAGDKIKLRYGSEKGSQDTLFMPSVDPTKFLSKGNLALLADGTLQLEIDQVENDSVHCTVVKGGNVRSRVGIAFLSLIHI